MAYVKKTWQCGETITANDLNHLEGGVENALTCDNVSTQSTPIHSLEMMKVGFQGVNGTSAIAPAEVVTITARATATYSNEFYAFVDGLNEGTDNGYYIVLTSFYCQSQGDQGLHIESIQYDSNELNWKVKVRNTSSASISASGASVGVAALVLKNVSDSIDVPYISCDGGGDDDDPPRSNEGSGAR